MSKYMHSGSQWLVATNANADYYDRLPVGNYVVRHDPQRGYSLEESAPFSVERTYGDIAKTAERVLTTYNARGKNTGVLAIGDKGTGKTLLTRLIAQRAAQQGIPTILVNDAFCGDAFNTFLMTIDQQAVVLLDEFEKTYDSDEQDKLLTLLDGVYQSSNKLFLLTANDEFNVNACFVARPGRIFYYLEFKPLEREFVVEFCTARLDDKSQIDAVVAVAALYGNFSFDALKALVEEMNRYGESPRSALQYLNIRIEHWHRYERSYNIVISRDGIEIDCENAPEMINLDPWTTEHSFSVTVDGADKDIVLKPNGVVAMQDGGRVIKYRYADFNITATASRATSFDPLTLLVS